MIGIGIDIGSTAAKAAVVDGAGSVTWTCVQPTGFSSVDAAERLRGELAAAGYDVAGDDARVVATGYGRVAVPYAHKVVTEITCHGTGAVHLFGDHGTVIDVGGQDTKVIQLKSGRVAKFAMNDKCAAGTGRFLEIMADRLGISQQQMADLARTGEPTKISSMCTVFAESEVISLIGRGEPRENIARGVIDSVVSRVATMAGQAAGAPYYLTGGLCENASWWSGWQRCWGRRSPPRPRPALPVPSVRRFAHRRSINASAAGSHSCVYWEKMIDR